jgi:hypothetical protein
MREVLVDVGFRRLANIKRFARGPREAGAICVPHVPGRIRNTLLMGATWKRQRNIWKRQRNIASLRRNAIAWLSRPRQMATARFWKKWLRLGE